MPKHRERYKHSPMVGHFDGYVLVGVCARRAGDVVGDGFRCPSEMIHKGAMVFVCWAITVYSSSRFWHNRPQNVRETTCDIVPSYPV